MLLVLIFPRLGPNKYEQFDDTELLKNIKRTKAADEFSRVVEQTGMLKQYPIDELAALIVKDEPTHDDFERIGKLLNGK